MILLCANLTMLRFDLISTLYCLDIESFHLFFLAITDLDYSLKPSLPNLHYSANIQLR
jgi:hypothetical protein